MRRFLVNTCLTGNLSKYILYVLSVMTLNYIGGYKVGKRAENKAPFSMYLDKDLKSKFKNIVELNNDSMTDIVTDAIKNYIKEYGQALEAK